jgi:scyllo-inositol 2-dehydrogenase (NADP+)
MRVVVAGMGVQGPKRQKSAGEDFVAFVDPFRDEAKFRRIEDVPLASYDAVLACIPDEPKSAMLRYCVDNGKSVLVEKPLWVQREEEIAELQAAARASGVVVYTAYNHRFEPHYVRMRDLIASGALGEIYSCRMFYGNGTARLVRESAWRDAGAGVLPDHGSHLLDTSRFWFGDLADTFRVVSAHNYENKSPDHVVIANDTIRPRIELEMTMLMWKNHFTCDVLAEKGSAHIESLCKWDTTTFTHRLRILPSGKPPEVKFALNQPDPTWDLEYAHFKRLVEGRAVTDLSTDLWLHRSLSRLGDDAIAQTGGRT